MFGVEISLRRGVLGGLVEWGGGEKGEGRWRGI